MSKEFEKVAWKTAEAAAVACVAVILRYGTKILIRVIFRV